MKTLFELNLDFVLWYKNRCSWDDHIDRTDNEIEVYKSGFLWGVILLGLSIFNIVLLPLFLISCIINFIYFLIFIPHYKKKEEKRRKKLEEIKNKLKNGLIEKWINKYEKHVKNTISLKLVTAEVSYGTYNVDYSKLEDFRFHKKMKSVNELIFNFLYLYNDSVKYKNVFTFDIKRKRIHCRNNARRSLGDLYSLALYYFPETTFRDIVEIVSDLIITRRLNYSYCGNVNKYVFYTSNTSNYRSSSNNLELYNNFYIHPEIKDTINLTFNDLIKYIEKDHG